MTDAPLSVIIKSLSRSVDHIPDVTVFIIRTLIDHKGAYRLHPSKLNDDDDDDVGKRERERDREKKTEIILL